MKTGAILLLFVVLALAEDAVHIHDFTPAHISSERVIPHNDGSVSTYTEILPVAKNGQRFHDPKKRVQGPFEPLPHFAGDIKEGSPLRWTGNCFQQMTGSLKISDSGFVINVNAQSPKSFTCQDYIIFATSSRYIFHLFIKRGDHTIKVPEWKNNEERLDVQLHGVRTFEVLNGTIVQTLLSLYEFYEDFLATNKRTEAELIKTHKDYFDYTFRSRTPTILDIPETAIQSGDVFVLHHMTGEQLEYWYLTGGRAGHACSALWWEGVLYIVEATDSTFFPPPYGFHMTPYKEWLRIYNEQNYEIVWLHLRPDLAAKYDVKKAHDFYMYISTALHGVWHAPSYGYVAIDTERDNVSPPLSPDAAVLLIALEQRSNAQQINDYLFEGLNMRFRQYFKLDAKCTTIECMQQLAALVNHTVFEVMALPEIDSWIYPKGPSIVCAGVAVSMLRAAGIFGNVEFNAGELHPRDLTALKIYDDVWADRPAGCSKTTGYCQLNGRWWVDIPDFNTVEPHTHMREHCGGKAPNYEVFPADC